MSDFQRFVKKLNLFDHPDMRTILLISDFTNGRKARFLVKPLSLKLRMKPDFLATYFFDDLACCFEHL